MSFCSGVEDSLIISICNEFNDERIIKAFEILDERLVKYNNELLKTKNPKIIKKIENKINCIKDCKLKNLIKFERYTQKSNKNYPKIKKMKNNFKNNIGDINDSQNIRNENNTIKDKVKIMENYNVNYFPRLYFITNKNLNINTIKNIIIDSYPFFDGYVKKIKDLSNKSSYNIIFNENHKKNKNIKLLFKNIIKSKDYYVLNSNKINLYFEIDKRDINNNYDYLFEEK